MMIEDGPFIDKTGIMEFLVLLRTKVLDIHQGSTPPPNVLRVMH